MRPSALDASTHAWHYTRDLLFRPFDPNRWLILGLLAFLESLSSGTGFGIPIDPGALGDPSSLDPAALWEEYRVVILLAAVLLLGIFLAFLIGFQWLSARAAFAYLDCVVTRRTEVIRPWREFRREGNSYFFWVLGITLGMLMVGAVVSVPLIFTLVGIEDFSRRLEGPIIATIVAEIAAIVLLVLFFAVVQSFIRDFILPIQWKERLDFRAAGIRVWRLAIAEPGAFVGFYCVKIVWILLAGGLIVSAVFVTCCAAVCVLVIPVIGQAFLQPIFVFLRTLPLFFLRQFGPEFDLFEPAPASAS